MISKKRAARDAETWEQHQTRLVKQNARRRRETPEEREARLAKAREYRQRCKAAETPERAEERKRRARERQRRRRAGMKSGEWQGREERERGRQVALAQMATTAVVLAAQQRQARWEQGWGRFLNWRTLAIVAGVAVVGTTRGSQAALKCALARAARGCERDADASGVMKWRICA